MSATNTTTSSSGAHTHSITVDTANVTTSLDGGQDTGSSGVSGVGKNLPPYMKLAYIMKG